MIQVNITKHCVAFPSKVLARDGGKHIFNIQLAEAADKFVKLLHLLHLKERLLVSLLMEIITLRLKVPRMPFSYTRCQ